MPYRRRPKIVKRHRHIASVSVLAVTLLIGSIIAFSLTDRDLPFISSTETRPALKPFAPSTYWNTPVPADAPVHPSSDQIISFLREGNARDGCVMLVGSGDDEWGTPIYWADESDQAYDVTSDGYDVPPEFAELRIPASARPAPNSDSELIIFDLAKGYVTHLSKAAYEEASDQWTVTGGSVAYLDSNGLDRRLDRSDDDRNIGSFRGYNGAVAAVRYDDVAAGTIQNVLKVAVSASSADAVFPMIGSDGDSTDPSAPPQGARLRIRPDVDLAEFDLPPQALAIAEALQSYGAIIADSSGGPVALKLEDTVTGERGQLWDITPDALCGIPIDSFEVLEYGYIPPEVESG